MKSPGNLLKAGRAGVETGARREPTIVPIICPVKREEAGKRGGTKPVGLVLPGLAGPAGRTKNRLGGPTRIDRPTHEP